MSDIERRTHGMRPGVPGSARRRRTGRDRGAAAIEAALVVPLLLFPLAFGVIQLGSYFWRAQEVDTLAPPVRTGAVAGDFSCTALKDAVVAEVVAAVNGLHPQIGDIDVSQVTVTVQEILPDVGVTVEVHIEANAGWLSSLIPLPGGGALMTDFSQRLSDVRVTDQVCR